MSGFRIEVDPGLIKELKQMSDKSKIQEAVKKGGASLQRSMKINARFAKGYSTGQTKLSISTEYKDGGLTAEVGPHTNYAAYLEYGTRFMEAQPFVKKSLDNTAPKFIKMLKATIEGGS